MAACTSCDFELVGERFCPQCGTPAEPSTVVADDPAPPPPPSSPPPPQQPPLPPPAPYDDGKRIAAGVCGILLGPFGVHKFILGYTSQGLIMLLVSLLTCGIGAVPFAIIGLVEGIIYLTKSPADFERIYVRNKRGWF